MRLPAGSKKTGLDEIVRLETDLDGDGTLEPPYTPLYDHRGHLVVLTDASGSPVERYRYTAYGPVGVTVDEVAPQVTQVRVLGRRSSSAGTTG